MKTFFKNNGLTIAMFTLFALSMIGQITAGFKVYNEDQRDHHQATSSLGEYLHSGSFVEAVFENWESEFLQMGSYVLLTVWLRQKGSPESKKMDEEEATDREPDPNKPDAPKIVKHGGWMLKIYRNSLALALFGLFFLSFILHAMGGARAYSEDQREHGQPGVSTIEYLQTSQMWFESLQNWQSEFLSVGVLVMLSVWLRQKGSPESKPVDAPNDETGGE